MKYLLSFFLIVFFCQVVNSCKNFLVQHCTDIPIGFNLISTIKCIQLIPIQFDSLHNYSVENYIIEKTNQCYNINLYNSSTSSASISLFSNECREICPDEYCLLFDNQSNTSIINIFYSPTSTYNLIQSLINIGLSYDYYLFDSCSSQNRINRILLIIVYILCAIVATLTIAVILKYIISWRLRKRRPYEPYSFYWILDCIFCQLRSEDEETNDPKKAPNDVESIEDHTPLGTNRSPRRTVFTTSTQPYPVSSGSTDINSNRQTHEYSSSDPSSHQRSHSLSSENNFPSTIQPPEPQYIYGYSELPETENDNHPTRVSLREKISGKASSLALSVRSHSIQYEQLEARPSPDIIIMRL